MAENRPLYLGPRLRRLRREMGLTQQAMADDLEISPSYVALLERNQRPVTADMLLRLAKTYRLDIADLAGDDGEDYTRRLTEVLRDPIFADIDLPALEVADLATSFPGVSEALLRLHSAYSREQQALAEQRAAGPGLDENEPVREAQYFLASRRNYFHAIDQRAEDLAAEIEQAGGAVAWLGGQGVRVRFLPPDVLMDSLRRFDRHNQQLLLADTLDGASRAFQIATHIAHTAMRTEIKQTLRAESFSGRATATLLLRALAGYGAAALRMPYGKFARAAEQRGYDIDALCSLFGVSFEQVAHRLTTLQRPGEERVGFFFIRVDEAGNVSKRLDGAGFPFAAHGGGCPLWSVHQVFRRPGEIATQWLELPGGERFFSIARTVVGGGRGYGRPRVIRAVALACAAEEAGRLVYAGKADPASEPGTPIGVTCRLCHRAACTARAVPPIGRDVLADDYLRAAQPYTFAES
ncbi:helix-turn-helix domain-containing protein [Novosphingobium mangrovi (ex Huang et al. 2023)]|uniref:Short-chain fatty acyl-CoA regulator family protein n=1 Tax=Novosphingobium mangrovi (ex Huang et al. 2023) TaxID=2976432 RepID=A0ABT2I4Q9_9SPHN|nr:helix-turn-helix transcriptional regulator [Novosphingobium mangrovi (ex Huang et al. 2023)]MCT2399798.1 short-chain fatty acyl-CoA regulator family protein [Novosphingobium mangrovi (ex Huang et al. 2023)]